MSPDVEGDLLQIIHYHVRTMKCKFAKVQSLVRNNIYRNTDHRALVAHLSGMHILSEEHEKTVAESSEVDQIFFILPKYWSILDFGISLT